MDLRWDEGDKVCWGEGAVLGKGHLYLQLLDGGPSRS